MIYLGLIILVGFIIYIVYRSAEISYLSKYWKEGHRAGVIKENWNEFIGINKIEGRMDDKLAILAVFSLIFIGLFSLVYLLVILSKKDLKNEEINGEER